MWNPLRNKQRQVWIGLTVIALATGCSREPKPIAEWETQTGLRVAEYVEGDGATPVRGDIVSVIYKASYVNGEPFDSYLDRDTPYTFLVGTGNVLPGLDEGVSTMRPGGRRVLVLPPHLAFGADGRPGVVPEDAWVEFDVELLSVEPGPPTPDPWNDVGYDMYATMTGLQFVDFEVGEGDAPQIGGTVVVHYDAYLDDGTCFDSTSYRGRPIEFVLDPNRVISGYVEGLLSMRVGGRRKLIIPPELAYGDEGYGKYIPPNATLVYDVVLLEVK